MRNVTCGVGGDHVDLTHAALNLTLGKSIGPITRSIGIYGIDRLTVDATELSDATLAERLAALTERERNLGQAIARGTITVAIGEEASTEIVAEREALEARIATNTTAAERVAALEGLPHDLGALWGEMTPREKNRVLRIVVDEVTINPSTVGGPKFDPGRVEVAWQTP